MKQGLGRVFVGGALLLAVSAAFAADSAPPAVAVAVINGCVDNAGTLRIVGTPASAKSAKAR